MFAFFVDPQLHSQNVQQLWKFAQHLLIDFIETIFRSIELLDLILDSFDDRDFRSIESFNNNLQSQS